MNAEDKTQHAAEGMLRSVQDVQRTTGTAGIADESDEVQRKETELELLRRSVDGDRQAFGEFVRLKRARIYRFATRICGPAEADDVAQVVFLRLWKELPAIKDLEKVDAWLSRTTYNRAIDTLRHIGRRLRLVLSEKEAGTQKMYVEPMHRGEIGAVFNRAAERIGERQRLAFLLTEMEGYTSAEAAELMEVEPSTVRNLAMQARAGLRQALRNLFPEYAPEEEQEDVTEEHKR